MESQASFPKTSGAREGEMEQQHLECPGPETGLARWRYPYPPTHLSERPGKSWTQTYTVWYGYAVVPWRLHEVLDLKITDLKKTSHLNQTSILGSILLVFLGGVSTSIRDVTCEGLLRLEAWGPFFEDSRKTVKLVNQGFPETPDPFWGEWNNDAVLYGDFEGFPVSTEMKF